MTPEEIAPRVSAALKLLQAEIDHSLFCPREAFALDKALLMVTGKGLRVGLAVCQLVETGFYGEAFGLTRSVLEAFFIVKYISSSKDSEARARSYLEFRKAHYYNQEELRKKYFPHVEKPENLTQEMLDEAKGFRSTRHWVAAWNMATDQYDHPIEIDQKTGKGFQSFSDYEGMYEMASHYVHCTVISSMPNFAASPFRTAKRDMEEDRGFLALHFSLVYAFMTCIILGRQWSVELRKEVHETIQALLAELRVVASPTGDWVVGVGKKP